MTFFVLLAVLGTRSYSQGRFDAAVERVVVVIVLFGCAVLHEFGHALAALQYGVSTPNITILPIGGLACLESMPDKPDEDAVVIIAGPIVDVIIAILLGAYLYLSFGVQTALYFEGVVASLPGQLLLANIALIIVFKLVPAFPMDRGLLLPAILTSQMEYLQATQSVTQLAKISLSHLPFLPFWLGLCFSVGWRQVSNEHTIQPRVHRDAVMAPHGAVPNLYVFHAC